MDSEFRREKEERFLIAGRILCSTAPNWKDPKSQRGEANKQANPFSYCPRSRTSNSDFGL